MRASSVDQPGPARHTAPRLLARLLPRLGEVWYERNIEPEGAPIRGRLGAGQPWGEIARAVEAGHIGRTDVTELGAVLTGDAPGRQHDTDITLFDSTGLVIQDLAIAKAALAKAGEVELQRLTL